MTTDLTRLQTALAFFADMANWKREGNRWIWQPFVSPGHFAYVALETELPAITYVTPNPADAEAVLTIAGFGFGTGEEGSFSIIDPQGHAIGGTLLEWSDTLIRVQLPGVGVGSVTVRVRTAAGVSEPYYTSVVLGGGER